MPKRTKLELEEILKQQLKFIKLSSIAFDNGEEIEAIRIAGHLRTLIYNSSNSKSLLSLLNMQDGFSVYDSAIPKGMKGGVKLGVNSFNLVLRQIPDSFYAGLLTKEIHGNCGTINNFLYSAPLCQSNLHTKIPIEDWWSKNIVFDDNANYSLTREALIKYVSNKDGYSHVEENPPQGYVVFKNENIVKININGMIMNPTNIPIYPAIRQISFEFLSSLYETHPQFFDF